MVSRRTSRTRSIAGAVVLASVAAWFMPAPASAAGGSTARVSVASDGTQGDLPIIGGPDISADGPLVVFSSVASNLIPGDTNNRTDLFVHDRLTRQTSRVLASTDFGVGAHPAISGDGR